MPKITRPKNRLKPFFWTKLTGPATASTVWNETASEFTIDLSDLESAFSIDDQANKSQLSVSAPKKQNVTTLLDITRANNVGEP